METRKTLVGLAVATLASTLFALLIVHFELRFAAEAPYFKAETADVVEGRAARLGAIGDAVSGASSLIAVLAVCVAVFSLREQLKSSQEGAVVSAEAITSLHEAINELRNANLLSAQVNRLLVHELAYNLPLDKHEQLEALLSEYISNTSRIVDVPPQRSVPTE